MTFLSARSPATTCFPLLLDFSNLRNFLLDTCPLLLYFSSLVGGVVFFCFTGFWESTMLRVRGLLGVLALLLAVRWLMAAGTKTDTEKKDPDPKAKGTLQANRKKLGLSEEQTQKIYKVQADYRAKIDVLEQQIKDLRQQEFTDQVKVLTEAQKARLKELGEFKDPTDPGKTDPDKKDDTKKDDSKKDDTKKEDVKKP